MNTFPLPAFRQIIEDISTFSIVYANQNAPRETKPYCAIKLHGNSGTDHSELFPQDGNDDRDVAENQIATIELNFYGPSAISEAIRVRNRLQFETMLDAFYAGNMALIDRGQVTNLTVLLNNSQYEQRAMFECRVGWRSVETENVGRIESVDMQGVLSLGDAPNAGVMTPHELTVAIALE